MNKSLVITSILITTLISTAYADESNCPCLKDMMKTVAQKVDLNGAQAEANLSTAIGLGALGGGTIGGLSVLGYALAGIPGGLAAFAASFVLIRQARTEVVREIIGKKYISVADLSGSLTGAAIIAMYALSKIPHYPHYH
jgi:hypothetical protein